jgi:hypothetical protein
VTRSRLPLVKHRLLVRPWKLDDAEAAFAVFGHADEARFAGGHAASVVASCANLEGR